MATVYIILGAQGSGRREVVADLTEALLEDESERCQILLSDSESADEAFAARLEKWDRVSAATFSLVEGEAIEVPEISEEVTALFFITDGLSNPVAQVEALQQWLAARSEEHTLGRIVTVLHSQLAHEHEKLFPWFEACIHFSDIVLFNRREDVPNKWFRDFEKYYHKHCFPCHFDIVKKGRVKNPAMILFPEPRRVSLIFDGLEDEAEGEIPEGIEIEIENADIDTEEALKAEEVEMQPSKDPLLDPYLKRNAAGQRAKRLPDIREFV